MAGERQTEPHQADRPIARSDRRLAAELPRAISVVTAADHDGETDALRAELARVRAERDEAQETVGEWKLRAERAERERDEISASLAKMDAKWRHAYNRLRDYEDRGTTDQFSQTRKRAEAAEARAENQVAEIVAAMRMEQAQGAVPISMMANWIEREFVDPAQSVRDRADVVAEIVALIRSYANVHMTKALADLIEHKYGGAGT